MNRLDYDVIIIGGSYAGLSAAMALGRSLRNVLILDTGKPCNKQTPHSHNFITHDGEAPTKITKHALAQVLNYPTVTFIEEEATLAEITSIGFSIKTQLGTVYTSKKLILATGIKDIMPNISGFSDCWGISVIHCPYCHGYEFKEKKTAILANGDRGFHITSLVNNLTNDIKIITNGTANFSTEQSLKLQKNKISIIEKPILSIEHENGYVQKVIFEDGSSESFKAVYAAIPFEQSSKIPQDLGCLFTENGHIKIDANHKTNIPGVFACGDNVAMSRTVANAVGSGNLAGAMVNLELTTEMF